MPRVILFRLVLSHLTQLQTCAGNSLQNYPYGKNRGDAHFAAHGLHVGSRMGCPWAAHGNFAMQIRLPTTSIYGNRVGSSLGSSVGSPLLPKMKKWAAQWAA